MYFSPLNGIITNHFDANNSHYGIDIVAKRNDAIKVIEHDSNSPRRFIASSTPKPLSTIKLINIYGQKLFETPLSGSNRQQITLNVSPGNYIVNVNCEKQSVNKKVLVN